MTSHEVQKLLWQLRYLKDGEEEGKMEVLVNAAVDSLGELVDFLEVKEREEKQEPASSANDTSH